MVFDVLIKLRIYYFHRDQSIADEHNIFGVRQQCSSNFLLTSPKAVTRFFWYSVGVEHGAAAFNASNIISVPAPRGKISCGEVLFHCNLVNNFSFYFIIFIHS